MRQATTHPHTTPSKEPDTAAAPSTVQTPRDQPRPRGAHRARPVPRRAGAHRQCRPPREALDRGLAATQCLALPALGLLLLLTGESTVNNALVPNKPTQAGSSTMSPSYPTGATPPPGGPSTVDTPTPPDGASHSPAALPTAPPPDSATAAPEPRVPVPTPLPATITMPIMTWKATVAGGPTLSPTTITTAPATITIRATPSAAPAPARTPSPPPAAGAPTREDNQTPFPVITLTERQNCETISLAPASLTAAVTQDGGHTVLTVFGTYVAPANPTTRGITIHTLASVTNHSGAVPLAEIDTMVPTEPASSPVPLTRIDLGQPPAPAVLMLSLDTTPAGCAPVTLTTLMVVLVDSQETSPAASVVTPSASETASSRPTDQ